MSWPAVKKAFTQEEFREYVAKLHWPRWRPSLVVWHNTAAPNIAQWKQNAEDDRAKGLIPGTTRIQNLEYYFRNQRGWSGAPHLFIAWDYIWVFNPLEAPGVHTPSWNQTSWGFEMVGDFSREDDDSGDGLRVKNNCIFATALLCQAIGIGASNETIKLHKEDPKTTHDCPGANIARDKPDMLAAVLALQSGGEHGIDIVPDPAGRRGIVLADGLNVRTGPGVDNPSVTSLWRGAVVTVLDEAKNGSTSWFKIRTPGGFTGAPHGLWVAGRFIRVE